MELSWSITAIPELSLSVTGTRATRFFGDSTPVWSEGMNENFGEETPPLRCVDSIGDTISEPFLLETTLEGLEAEIDYLRQLDAPYLLNLEDYMMC